MLGPVLLTVCLGFTVLSVYVVRTAQSNLTSGIDEELQRARAGPAAPRGSSTDESPEGTTEGRRGDLAVDPPVQLAISNGGTVLDGQRSVNPFDARELVDLAQSRGIVTVEGEPRYRALVTARVDGTVSITALSMAQVDESVASLRASLMVGGLVVFLVCSMVVWWIATLVARPVTKIALLASRIAGGALETTIDEPSGGSREVAVLAANLRGMVDELRTTIADREHQAHVATKSRDAMRRFLADASHELRTPLTALAGYSDLYQHSMLAEKADLDRAMHRIGSESLRLTRLVNEMLDLARGNASGMSRVEDVDLKQLVADVVHDLHAAFPNHLIELSGALDAPLVVRGDVDRLHRAVLNLGANACLHNTPDVAVAVHLAPSDAVAMLSIVDNGRGVDGQHLDNLFTPFYRADSSRSRTSSAGGGLGLALTKLIVTAHHGTVDYEPTPGGGATFRIELPRPQPGSDGASQGATSA
ncbi:MAG: sensor histidine kinase [Nocardioides sp.]